MIFHRNSKLMTGPKLVRDLSPGASGLNSPRNGRSSFPTFETHNTGIDNKAKLVYQFFGDNYAGDCWWNGQRSVAII